MAGRCRNGLLAAALVTLVLATVFPATWWKVAAWSWYIGTNWIGVQSSCWDANPAQKWLFMQAEKAAAAVGNRLHEHAVVEMTRDTYTWQKLYTASEEWTKPVVVRGLFADAPALDIWKSPQHLLKWFPDASLKALIPFRAGNTPCETAGYGVPAHTLSEVVEAATDGRGVRCSVWVPEGNNISAVMEELVADRLNIPESQGMGFHGRPGFFITNPGSKDGVDALSATWHSAPGGNLAVHATESKVWRLVPPSLSHMMRPASAVGGMQVLGEPDEHLLTTVIRPLKLRADPGDMLFLPAWYWHEVWHVGEPKWTVLATWRPVMMNVANSPWLTVGAMPTMMKTLLFKGGANQVKEDLAPEK